PHYGVNSEALSGVEHTTSEGPTYRVVEHADRTRFAADRSCLVAKGLRIRRATKPSPSAAKPTTRPVMGASELHHLEKDSNRRLHADRSRRTGVDSFFDHLQFSLSGLEGVFGSTRNAARVGQIDIRLLADLKQPRFDANADCGEDTSGRVDLYGDLRHRCSPSCRQTLSHAACIEFVRLMLLESG